MARDADSTRKGSTPRRRGGILLAVCLVAATTVALTATPAGALERIEALALNAGEDTLYSAVIDPAGKFAYFGTYTNPGRVVKVDLADFTRVGAITLNTGENGLVSAVIDPAGEFAYFGTDTSPGRVVKVDLDAFTRVGAITLNTGEDTLFSAVIDPAGDFAYFGTAVFAAPGRVVKVDLADFTRVGAVTLNTGENGLVSAVIDPAGGFAYFGTYTDPGRVVKVNLDTFAAADVETVILGADENRVVSAVVDPAGEFAYFGLETDPGKAIKFRISEPPLDDGSGHGGPPGGDPGPAPDLDPEPDVDPGPDPDVDPPREPDLVVCGDHIPPAGFSDVDPTSTHAAAIDCAAFHRIMLGLGDGTFGPDLHLRRDQLASLLDRVVAAAGHALPAADSHPFDDLDGNVHADAVARLAAAGIVHGTTPTTFAPAELVRRDQLAALLMRALAWVAGGDLPPVGGPYFADTAGNPHRQAIDAAFELGLVHGQTAPSGTELGVYGPADPVIRAQAASMLTRLLEALHSGI